MTPESNFKASGIAVINLEAEAIAHLSERIGADFQSACELILACKGRVVVVGMGKSGHIGGKIASTLASTGTPSFFVHPGEASHGDLGMITPGDVVIAISNSGETPEILTILPIVKRMDVILLAITGNPDSTLGRTSDACLNVSVESEACPHNLAPTASTTATLAMGDAVAIAVLKARGFSSSDFARSHPGGALGRRLLLYVSDVMHSGERIPLVPLNSTLSDVLIEMSSKGLGMAAVVDDDQRLAGVYTDGDLRRTLNRSVDIHDCLIQDIMTKDPVTTTPDALATELITIMRTHSINGIFAVDQGGKVQGALNTLDLLRAGIL
ncbi:MAG: arabinose-5-phosphate isomerase [Parasphingorhabdus sp.]|jgi:arabinose-5-phosphate isomerase